MDLECLWQLKDSKLMTCLPPLPSSAFFSPTILERFLENENDGAVAPCFL